MERAEPYHLRRSESSIGTCSIFASWARRSLFLAKGVRTQTARESIRGTHYSVELRKQAREQETPTKSGQDTSKGRVTAREKVFGSVLCSRYPKRMRHSISTDRRKPQRTTTTCMDKSPSLVTKPIEAYFWNDGSSRLWLRGNSTFAWSFQCSHIGNLR